MKNKTTSQVYDQNLKLSRLLHEVTTAAILKAHPETGGSLHLAHNWGNKETRKILDQYHNRQFFLFKLGRIHYQKAFKKEYPEHRCTIQMY